MNYRDKIYSRYASIYRGSGTLPSEVPPAAEIYRYYLRGWLPESREAVILDAGCGEGKLLRLFQVMGYANLHGVDLSDEQVALARRVSPFVCQANAIEFLEKTDLRFDLVCAIDLAEHLTKDELMRFLAAARRGLRTGGRLVIQTPNAASPFFGIVRYGDLTHEIAFQSDLLGRLLVLHGFKDVTCREAGPIPWGVSGRARWCLWQLLRGLFAVYHYIEIGYGRPGICTRVFFGSGVAA